jgi:hypothetical protein
MSSANIEDREMVRMGEILGRLRTARDCRPAQDEQGKEEPHDAARAGKVTSAEVEGGRRKFGESVGGGTRVRVRRREGAGGVYVPAVLRDVAVEEASGAKRQARWEGKEQLRPRGVLALLRYFHSLLGTSEIGRRRHRPRS